MSNHSASAAQDNVDQAADLIGGLIAVAALLMLIVMAGGAGGVGLLVAGAFTAASTRWVPENPLVLRLLVWASAATSTGLGLWYLFG